MAQAPRDQNFVPTILLESSENPSVVFPAKGDQTTGRLLVDISIRIEIPTGAVNGVNTTFTVTNTPRFLIVDGLTRRVTKGYTYSSGTIEVDPLTPPNFDIFSIY